MDNYYILKITCKNPKRFIEYLHHNNINIYNIKYIDEGLVIKVLYQDYLNILKIKTSYKIEIIDIIGIRKLSFLFLKNKIFIILFLISILIIFLMSNIIFKIEYVDVSNDIKPNIMVELDKYNIKVFSFKKSYGTLDKIKANIKNNNDNIEWIELTNQGMKLVVKAIERKNILENSDKKISNIVASKDGFLINIMAKTGEVVKNPGDYVKKGDIIISGFIKNKEDIVNVVAAEGKVYAEVWYVVSLEKPLSGVVKKYGDKSANQYVFYLFGKRINFFKDKYEKVEESIIINGKIFQMTKEYRREVISKKENYSQEEIQKILEEESKNKINDTLNSDEKIILKKVLKKYVENGKMKVEIFFKVKEEIGIGQKIDMVE